MNAREQTIINLLENFGFKLRQSGKEKYFLQTKKQFKPMTKIKMESLLDLYVSEKPVAKKKAPVKDKVEEVKEE